VRRPLGTFETQDLSQAADGGLMGQFDVEDLLAIVEVFGSAGRGLIAWELTLDEEAIEPTGD
jgi:hypothetical protein